MPVVLGMSNEELKAIVGLSPRAAEEKIGPALIAWLYDDPRFASNRQAALGEVVIRRTIERLQRGESLEEER